MQLRGPPKSKRPVAPTLSVSNCANCVHASERTKADSRSFQPLRAILGYPSERPSCAPVTHRLAVFCQPLILAGLVQTPTHQRSKEKMSRPRHRARRGSDALPRCLKGALCLSSVLLVELPLREVRFRRGRRMCGAVRQLPSSWHRLTNTLLRSYGPPSSSSRSVRHWAKRILTWVPKVWMDVTDMVNYNLQLLNPADLTSSFFCLSKTDPSIGFAFDCSSVAGQTHPEHADSPSGKSGQSLF